MKKWEFVNALYMVFIISNWTFKNEDEGERNTLLRNFENKYMNETSINLLQHY